MNEKSEFLTFLVVAGIHSTTAGRSGSAPYQTDLAIENPTHGPIRVLRAPRLSRHTPVLSGDVDAIGSGAVMVARKPAVAGRSGAGSQQTRLWG